MNTNPKLNFLLRARRLLWYFSVIILVIVAISMTLARSLISNVGELRGHLEDIASQYLEQPLRIETFDAKLIGFTPTFIFKNVSFLERSSNKVMVRFKEAKVGLSLFKSIKNVELTPKSFVINGINLVVTQNKNNTLKVRGIDVAEFDPAKNIAVEDSNELSNWLFQQDKLKLENSTIHWYNAITDKALTFSNINLQINNSEDRHTLSGDWQLQSTIAKRFKIELDLTGDILNPASWEGAAYVKGEDVNISEFGIPSNLIPLKPASGIYNFEVWANFKLGQLKELAGSSNVRNLKFNSSKLNKEIKIDKMGAVWRWDNLADGWALNIDRFYYEVNKKIWPLSRVLVESHHRFQPDSIIDIYIDELDVEDANEFIQKIKLIEQEKLIKLANLDIKGRISNTHIRFKVSDIFSDDFMFQTNFLNITSKSDGYIPGVENLTGVVSTSNTLGSMIVDSHNVNIDFPQIFRNKIDVKKLEARLDWRYINNEWRLSSDNLSLKNNDIELNSNLQITFPEKKSPYIDLQVLFQKGNIANAGKYYPVSIMGQELIEWLDFSLKSGEVKQGGVVLRGRLNKFPYLNYGGKFEVSLQSNNFKIEYLKKWPQIHSASADINFTGSGFDIDISKAKIFNSTINHANIYIKDFTAPELVITGNIDSATSDVFKYLVNSPIASESSSVIDGFKITGKSKIKIKINVPLSEKMEKIHSTYYDGSIEIRNSMISFQNGNVDFNQINGNLGFSEKGFNSDGLSAIVFDKKAKIRVYSQSKEKTFSHHILVEGGIDSKTISEKLNIPLMGKSSDTTQWQGIFNFGYVINDKKVPSSIVVTSDFNGISLNFPMPFKKIKNTALPISFESKFISSNEFNINFSLNENVKIASLINVSKKRIKLKSANINFGENVDEFKNKNSLNNNIVYVNGNIKNIDLPEWYKFINELNLKKNKISNSFISQDFKIIFDVDSYLITTLADDDFSETKKEIQKKNGVITTSGIDPRQVPEFSGDIRNIFYGDSKVGSLSFDFKHTTNGFDIKKLNLVSDDFKVNSTGIWHIFPNKEKDRYLTKFTNVKFISSNLGATLSALGFKSILNKGKSDSDMTIWWHDSPFDFSLKKLSAEISVNVSDGEILDIDPKAGRLLGLLSLSNLPRRLLGDFSDIFSSGLSFDTANGQIRIANGIMTSDNISMTSSPAEIQIFGETDLVKRNFDQKIKVIPNLTDTTAVLGGLLGGLPALIATKILGGIIDLDKAEMRTYHVTGSWEEPVITTIKQPEPEYTDDSDDDEN